jgi:hypothetical protein
MGRNNQQGSEENFGPKLSPPNGGIGAGRSQRGFPHRISMLGHLATIWYGWAVGGGEEKMMGLLLMLMMMAIVPLITQ